MKNSSNSSSKNPVFCFAEVSCWNCFAPATWMIWIWTWRRRPGRKLASWTSSQTSSSFQNEWSNNIISAFHLHSNLKWYRTQVMKNKLRYANKKTPGEVKKTKTQRFHNRTKALCCGISLCLEWLLKSEQSERCFDAFAIIYWLSGIFQMNQNALFLYRLLLRYRNPNPTTMCAAVLEHSLFSKFYFCFVICYRSEQYCNASVLRAVRYLGIIQNNIPQWKMFFFFKFRTS